MHHQSGQRLVPRFLESPGINKGITASQHGQTLHPEQLRNEPCNHGTDKQDGCWNQPRFQAKLKFRNVFRNFFEAPFPLIVSSETTAPIAGPKRASTVTGMYSASTRSSSKPGIPDPARINDSHSNQDQPKVITKNLAGNLLLYSILLCLGRIEAFKYQECGKSQLMQTGRHVHQHVGS